MCPRVSPRAGSRVGASGGSESTTRDFHWRRIATRLSREVHQHHLPPILGSPHLKSEPPTWVPIGLGPAPVALEALIGY